MGWQYWLDFGLAAAALLLHSPRLAAVAKAAAAALRPAPPKA